MWVKLLLTCYVALLAQFVGSTVAWGVFILVKMISVWNWYAQQAILIFYKPPNKLSSLSLACSEDVFIIVDSDTNVFGKGLKVKTGLVCARSTGAWNISCNIDTCPKPSGTLPAIGLGFWNGQFKNRVTSHSLWGRHGVGRSEKLTFSQRWKFLRTYFRSLGNRLTVKFSCHLSL